MPKSGFPLSLALLGALFCGTAEAKRGCPDQIREIRRLYNARDPALLAVNILEPGCTPKELYQAAYYQGFGFYFVGRYKDALANLQLARGLTGPWDEQILQYIWTLQGKLGDSEGQSRTLEELREDFPQSPKLVEMETAESRAVKTSFDGLATVGFGWQSGDRTYQGARSQNLLGGSWTQTRGGHSVSEYVNLTGILSLENRRHQYGMDGGLLYRGPALSAQAEGGFIRTRYNSASLDSMLPDQEFVGTASLARSFKRSGGWTWTANATYLYLGPAYSSYGLTWEMDHRAGFRTHNFEVSAELQDLRSDGACLYLEEASDRCESLGDTTFYAAVEAGWEGGRRAGRHSLGAEIRLRFEEGIKSPNWRGLATGGFVHGFWLAPGLKLSNVLDLGGEWWEDGFDPVTVLRTTMAWVF